MPNGNIVSVKLPPKTIDVNQLIHEIDQLLASIDVKSRFNRQFKFDAVASFTIITLFIIGAIYASHARDPEISAEQVKLDELEGMWNTAPELAWQLEKPYSPFQPSPKVLNWYGYFEPFRGPLEYCNEGRSFNKGWSLKRLTEYWYRYDKRCLHENAYLATTTCSVLISLACPILEKINSLTHENRLDVAELFLSVLIMIAFTIFNSIQEVPVNLTHDQLSQAEEFYRRNFGLTLDDPFRYEVILDLQKRKTFLEKFVRGDKHKHRFFENKDIARLVMDYPISDVTEVFTNKL